MSTINNAEVKEETAMRYNGLSEQAVDFILTRNTEELAHLTETGISRVLGASRDVLRRLFKANQRISLDRFILREKLHRAFLVMDKEPEISDEMLSRILGFRNSKSFSQEFENYLAIKPARYKKLRTQKKKPGEVSL
jgi:AraC-like DNA-binding protein